MNWQQNKEYSIWYFFICTHYPAGQSQFLSLSCLVREEEVTETASQHEICALTEAKALQRREIQWTFILPRAVGDWTALMKLDPSCTGDYVLQFSFPARFSEPSRTWVTFHEKEKKLTGFLFCVVISSLTAKSLSIWDLNKGGYSYNNGELDLVLSERSFESMSS